MEKFNLKCIKVKKVEITENKITKNKVKTTFNLLNDSGKVKVSSPEQICKTGDEFVLKKVKGQTDFNGGPGE